MTFLHLQLALAGFAAIAIPILIHLLMRRRRKPVMWGAMRFLLEAYKKHRRRLMLEKWLLLLTRCLLIAALAAAIGRPLLGELFAGSGGRVVYVLLDNSLAAQAVGEDGRTALQRNKEAARELLAALQTSGGDNDRAALITLGGPADNVVVPASADLASVQALIDAVVPTDSRADISGGLAAVVAAIEAERSGNASGGGVARRSDAPVFLALFSDFLDGSADVSASLAKLPANVRLLASVPGAARPNVAIVGVEPERSVVVVGRPAAADVTAPAAPALAGEQVRVMLRRSGPSVAIAETTTISARMLAGQTQRTIPARAQARWAPGQDVATVVVQLRPDTGVGARTAGSNAQGIRVIEARIEGGGASGAATGRAGNDSILGDDLWRRPVEIRDALRVGVVAPRRFGDSERADRLDAGDWAKLALRPGEDAGIDVVDIDPSAVDGARLSGLDAVVIPRPDLVPVAGWQRIRLFLDGGGLLILTPSPVAGAQLWTDAMITELGVEWKLAREATIFASQQDGAAPMTIAPLSAPAVDPGAAAADAGVNSSLLSLIRGELDELLRPVNVWQALAIDSRGAPGAALLSLADGSPLVWAGPVPPAKDAAAAAESSQPDARGMIVYIASAFDLRWSDLPAKPLMVPLMQELVREGIGRAQGVRWSVAGGRPLVPSRTSELRVEATDGAEAQDSEAEHAGLVTISESGEPSQPLRRAGLWRAVDDRGAARSVLAINPDPRAGVTESNELGAVEQWLAAAASDAKVNWLAPSAGADAGATTAGNATAASQVFARNADAGNFSFPLFVLALLLAIFELVLARMSSHAGVIEPKGVLSRGGAA